MDAATGQQSSHNDCIIGRQSTQTRTTLYNGYTIILYSIFLYISKRNQPNVEMTGMDGGTGLQVHKQGEHILQLALLHFTQSKKNRNKLRKYGAPAGAQSLIGEFLIFKVILETLFTLQYTKIITSQSSTLT